MTQKTEEQNKAFTAVEFLYEISKRRSLDESDLKIAKAMEKQQIKDIFFYYASLNIAHIWHRGNNSIIISPEFIDETAEDYYQYVLNK